MMLIVFVQEKHFAYVRAVAAETVGTGLMGKLGNKVLELIFFVEASKVLFFQSCSLIRTFGLTMN